jgi:phytol kinase
MRYFMIFCLALIMLFLIIDILQKHLIKSFYWSRKATHISAGAIIYLMPYWLDRWQIFGLGILFAGILAISKWKNLLSLHGVERKTWGEILYPVSISILSLISLPDYMQVFQISSLVLAVSDGLAGIIGEALNFHAITIFHNTKSLGGAIVFFLSTISILLVFHGFEVSLIKIVLVSILLTITEFILYFGSDNLGVPLMTALLELQLLV